MRALNVVSSFRIKPCKSRNWNVWISIVWSFVFHGWQRYFEQVCWCGIRILLYRQFLRVYHAEIWRCAVLVFPCTQPYTAYSQKDQSQGFYITDFPCFDSDSSIVDHHLLSVYNPFLFAIGAVVHKAAFAEDVKFITFNHGKLVVRRHRKQPSSNGRPKRRNRAWNTAPAIRWALHAPAFLPGKRSHIWDEWKQFPALLLVIEEHPVHRFI